MGEQRDGLRIDWQSIALLAIVAALAGVLAIAAAWIGLR
jgi:hypothetical protein